MCVAIQNETRPNFDSTKYALIPFTDIFSVIIISPNKNETNSEDNSSAVQIRMISSPLHSSAFRNPSSWDTNLKFRCKQPSFILPVLTIYMKCRVLVAAANL